MTASLSTPGDGQGATGWRASQRSALAGADADPAGPAGRDGPGLAAAANPHVSLLAGLSTNPPGPAVSSRQLAAAIRVSSAAVAGYWLNVPGQGPSCPACNAPRPGLARQMLGEFAS